MACGKLNEFDINSGNWTLYVERLEMYLKVNKVEKDLWLPTLITAIGDQAYELLSSLASPLKPAQLTYDAAVALLHNHLQPRPSVMAERYRFRQRRQRNDESVAQYVTELKKLSKYCEFTNNLEENLRDQLVCGLRSDVTRQRLFAEDNLNYNGALKLACALEAAERDAAVVEGSKVASVEGVHVMMGHGSKEPETRQSGPKQHGPRHPVPSEWTREVDKNCSTCGKAGHNNKVCRYKGFTCRICKKKGHLQRVCPRSGSPRRGKKVNHVAASDRSDGDSSSEDMEEELHQLSLNSYKPI
ncbi:uncharacterized protein LOC125075690 isoform X2 [Vanessa atalanta]|uniref:uncharacterized protein LOC125067454 isoform X2 n=1 Tax=Vanessa atalanta TaxID=42275 RepID=UPI001FCDFAC4|nr:uncharacterized protein LOC125067454 isoform X2 [Vanessa atalanta]XP_047539212.1 uncharacterized protein LOC125072621 isoform X2 [Vanessa atalanta]XP_047543355.1 uncharacterized protein LOC125075690 isoform X2 [Vanessa atalanta]